MKKNNIKGIVRELTLNYMTLSVSSAGEEEETWCYDQGYIFGLIQVIVLDFIFGFSVQDSLSEFVC